LQFFFYPFLNTKDAKVRNNKLISKCDNKLIM
jgi:hypothetical protein